MSLSEQNKCCIRGICSINQRGVLQAGPVRVVDMLLDTDPPPTLPTEVQASIRAANSNLLDNRREAEQYLAGLLGMM